MVSFCHFNYTMYLGVIFLGLILLGALCSSWSFPRSGEVVSYYVFKYIPFPFLSSSGTPKTQNVQMLGALQAS